MDPAKVEKVKNYPRPKNITQVRGFLGLAGYYRKFVKGFAKRSAPLTELLRKGVAYKWTNRQEEAFEDLKNCLISTPIRVYPDFNEPFILLTDASTVAIGAILSQKDQQGNERVIAYASRQLRPAEKNYYATELECLAVVWSIKHFSKYLYGSKFILFTDHSALTSLQNKTDVKGRLARWIMSLQPYDYEVKHREGNRMKNVDALSRIKTDYWD
jgi:hypothetical protein